MPGGSGLQPVNATGKMPVPPQDELRLRKALLSFIADFANWDNSAKPAYLECARGLVRAAHMDSSGKMPEPPLVVDPFAGGGSIPLEALRVGCDAFASDLNPVACLILKVLLEDIPRHGPALAEELRRVGKQIKDEAEKELAEFYPPDPDGARPIAYLWARTGRCEAVGCGAEIPLMRSFWLCKKANRRRALRLRVIKPSGTGFQPVSSFQAVNPWKSANLSATGRNLPHLQVPEATYFVTFRCQKELSLPEEARDLAMSALRHWDGKRIDMDIGVIMPDHVHAIFRIVDGSPLSGILHSIKSYSANQINKRLGRSGGFWLDESFDHIIRNGDEWEEKAEYVRQNPVKEGLAEGPEAYRWLYVRGQEGPHRLEACATPRLQFEIFEPKAESEVRVGTVNRGNATCPCCNTVLPVARVRVQLAAQHGGADVIFSSGSAGFQPARNGGARLLAVVTLDENKSGRQYRLPTERDYEAVWKAEKALEGVAATKLPNGLSPIPDEPTPAGGGSGAGRAFSVQKYGMMQWGDLFTARQKVALVRLVQAITTHTGTRISTNHSDTLSEILAIVLSRVVDKCAALVYWHDSREFVDHVFARQALIPQWNTAEAPVFSAVCFEGASDWIAAVIERGLGSKRGQAQAADATEYPLPDSAASVWFTDPPYYDAVPYADLSDFFFVWLRRTLPDHPLLRNPFEPGNPLTPKCAEIVQDETKKTPDGRAKDKAFF
ncbi:MAG: REP-associated tyrosine transposase, partial [Terriglobia bacterium]